MRYSPRAPALPQIPDFGWLVVNTSNPSAPELLPVVDAPAIESNPAEEGHTYAHLANPIDHAGATVSDFPVPETHVTFIPAPPITYEGGPDDDTSIGGDGDDSLSGEGGDDILFGGGFNPDGTLADNSGNDTLKGGAGDDRLWGGDGDDILRGGIGGDWLVGGAGDDLFDDASLDSFTSFAPDYLFGGSFAPDGSFLPGSGNDRIFGGMGNDGIWGADGDDSLQGAGGDDYIEGGAGNDFVHGNDGNDTVFSQDGDDIVGGGRGFDYLYGGGGADTFLFQHSDSYDYIWDFSAAEGDKLSLDLVFGIKDFADFTSRLGGFRYDGADYTVLSLTTTVTTAGNSHSPGEKVTYFDQVTIKGIAHTDWTPALVEGFFF